VIKLQREFARWKKQWPAYEMRYPTGVTYLEDLLKTVAARSVIRSKRLYALMRKRVAPEDATLPAGLSVEARYAKIRNSDKRALSHIYKCYKFAREDFGLVPPKKSAPKKAPAKDGAKQTEKKSTDSQGGKSKKKSTGSK
jgi:hypothetical protein